MPVGFNGAAIGDLAVTRYVRHPAGTVGNWLLGQPLDSSTADLVGNNLAWLSYEGGRQLVASQGISVAAAQNAQDPWNGFVDAPTLGAGFAPNTSNEIPWSPRESMRFGPFWGICDQVITAAGSDAGATTLRKVRVRVRSDNPGFSSVLYFAMTLGPSPLALSGGTFLDYQKVTISTTTTDVTLFDGSVSPSTSAGAPQGAAAIPPTAHRPELSGPSIATGSPYVDVVPFWIWVGARFPHTGGGSIYTVSAWEAR